MDSNPASYARRVVLFGEIGSLSVAAGGSLALGRESRLVSDPSPAWSRVTLEAIAVSLPTRAGQATSNGAQLTVGVPPVITTPTGLEGYPKWQGLYADLRRFGCGSELVLDEGRGGGREWRDVLGSDLSIPEYHPGQRIGGWDLPLYRQQLMLNSVPGCYFWYQLV